MPNPKQSRPTWSTCKTALRGMPQPKLLAFLRELYNLNPETQRFFHARLIPAQSGHDVTAIKRQLKSMLSVQAVWNNRFRHADIKRLIDQFAKASQNPEAVADLLVTDLELGFPTFNEIGDFDKMVNHFYSTFRRLDEVLATLIPESRQPLVARLVDLASQYKSSFGYGLSDELGDLAANWNERCRE